MKWMEIMIEKLADQQSDQQSTEGLEVRSCICRAAA